MVSPDKVELRNPKGAVVAEMEPFTLRDALKHPADTFICLGWAVVLISASYLDNLADRSPEK